MASASSWKSPFQSQEMVETQIFTWRLRPHVTHQPPTGHNHNGIATLNPARNSKSSNLSGVSRLLAAAGTGNTTAASQSLSSSVLPTTSSNHQVPQHQEKFLKYQEFEIEAGQSLGLHSMWSLFFISCGSSTITQQKSSTNVAGGSSNSSGSSGSPSANSDFIGLFLRKIFKPTKSYSSYSSGSKGDEIVARYKIEIMDREGEVLYHKEFESLAKDSFEVGFWDWKKIVPLSKFYGARGKLQTKEVIQASESGEESLLLLRVSFTIGTRRKEMAKAKSVVEGSPHVGVEAEISTGQAANAFLGLVTSSKSLQPDVVIEIPNRRKFSVHKRILAERSHLFKKLLGPDTPGNKQSQLKIDDFSGNTMELILKHIYTGQLEEEWTTNPVTITELINASEKYGLPALKEFCSTHLVKAATKNNCYKLMEVAQIHNLEQAAEELMSYASEGISSNPNSRRGSKESVEAEV